MRSPEFIGKLVNSGLDYCILYNKPPAMQVDPHPALALDNKTSNAIISVGPKPHYK